MRHTPGLQPFQNPRSHVGHISFRPSVKKLRKPVLELLVAAFGEIRQCVDKHKFGQNRERDTSFSMSAVTVHSLVVVFKISPVSLLIKLPPAPDASF